MSGEASADGGTPEPDGGAVGSEPLNLNVTPPETGPISQLKHFGPGILLMMTGVGTSHIITIPTAAGRFGWALLWAIPVAYAFKWYGFRMAYRFTYATGKSVMDAMNTTRRKWALWYVLLVFGAQMTIGQAGRLIAAAAVLYFAFTVPGFVTIPLWAYAVLVGGVSLGIILSGRYRVVELTVKAILVMVVSSFVIVYLVDPPDPSAYVNFFVVDVPPEAWLVFAASIGLLPTGIDVSLQASEWGLAKKKGLPRLRAALEENGAADEVDPFGNPTLEEYAVRYDELPERTREYCYRWFRIGVRDFDYSNLVSFVLAVMIMSLAVVWIYPSAVEGTDAIGEIAAVFTDSVGGWIMGLFLLGAFGITFSTQFNYFDGRPRVISAACRNLFRRVDEWSGVEAAPEGAERVWYSEYNIWRASMIVSFLGAVAIIAGVPEPVFVVLVASALAAVIAPVIFFFNFWFCLRAIPEDSDFYPARWEIYFTWISLAVFTVLVGLSLLAMFDLIHLFIPGVEPA
jgi:Mn2+/Fe2+ NRAMP family transporter